MERNNGQTLLAKPYLENINWTKGIDQKTGKPLDYDPSKDIQTYSGAATPMPDSPTKKMCPAPSGRQQFLAVHLQPEDQAALHSGATPCVDLTQRAGSAATRPATGRAAPTSRPSAIETDLTAADPLTGEIKKNVHIPYPNYSGALSTAGGLVFTGFTDGTFAAYDDTTLEQLWKINVGTGFNAPPMTFEVNGKQYVAILAGLSPIARGKHQLIPELKEQRNQTMLFVFGL